MRNNFVREKRAILDKIIDVVKLIGKTGILYGGKTNKATYTLSNNLLNMALS